jgi:thiamine-phosphate diphosphorylase
VVGVSTHGLEESREASALGADFLLLGTIFSTPSHPGMPGSGVELISSCAGVGTPVIAIGGIDVQSVGPVISAGAHGVAVIRAVLERDDPAAEVRRLICALEEYTETVDPPAEGEARV